MKKSPLTKQGYVYDSLKADIQSGLLRPDTKLPLNDLVERFGVSHIPIREALRTLEKENLVELNPHASAKVMGITTQEAIWIADLRCQLEPLAVSQAIASLNDKALKTIEAFINDLDRVIEPMDLPTYIDLNNQLHRFLVTLTPNKFLSRIVNELVDTSSRYRLVVGVDPANLKIWQAEHKMLLAALKEGDDAAVERIMRLHLSHIMEVLLAEQSILSV